MESKTKIEIINTRVKKIIYNDPATIVFWGDGSKTVVKCMKGEKFNPYHGFTAALAKHIYGSSSTVNTLVAFGFSQPVVKKDPTPVNPKKYYAAPLKAIFHGRIRMYNWMLGQYTLTFEKESDAVAYIHWAVEFIRNHGWLTEELALGETSDPRYTYVWLSEALSEWERIPIELRYGKYEIDIPRSRRFERCFAKAFPVLHTDYADGVYELTFESSCYADEFLNLMMLYADANNNWCPEEIVHIPYNVGREIEKKDMTSSFGWTREELLQGSQIFEGQLTLPRITHKYSREELDK